MASQWWRDNEDGPADLTMRSTHFFKIIMPRALQEGKIRIPTKFISKYGVDLSDMAFLTIPNGTNWKVKVTKHDGGVWFQNGWCEFASCHGLTVGHLLVFRYIGNSHFHVLIFDATATEIDYTLDDQLQVCRMEDNESDDDSVEIMDGFTKGEGSGSDHRVGGNRVGCTSSSLVKVESDQCPKKDGGVAENLVRANALKSDNPLFTVTIHPSYIDGKDCASLPWAIINYLPREGFTKDYSKGSILTVKLQLYVYEQSVGSSCVVSASWSAFARENTLRVGDVCIFELIMRDDVVLKVHIFKCIE
ncbi:b3 domain-containing transcription factor vrn1 [Quercus suber]|uniref:B3 domain-containing transcription factor vrn1 n=1 Tax=Quercus suber TaxID=58331 RepID=A0AAW0KM04_QUESU